MKTLPEVGTLEEIGANVGDVVRFEGSKLGIGEELTLTSGAPEWAHDKGCRCGAHDHPSWRMIRRASNANPGPVREVTRKEIVPGVYGRIEVHSEEHGKVALGFTRGDLLSRADLIAARDVFNQLIDALEGME